MAFWILPFRLEGVPKPDMAPKLVPMSPVTSEIPTLDTAPEAEYRVKFAIDPRSIGKTALLLADLPEVLKS